MRALLAALVTLFASQAAAKEVVPGSAAVAAFMDICIATAPTFDGAEDRMAEHGLTRRAETGMVYDASGTLSVKIAARANGAGAPVQRCAVVTATEDVEGTAAILAEALRAAAEPFELLGPRDIGAGPGWTARGTMRGQPVAIGYLKPDPAVPHSLLVIEILE